MSVSPTNRSRREGANYEWTSPPDPLRRTVLSLRRKSLIMDFRRENRENVGTIEWLKRLHKHVIAADKIVTMEDIRRWIKRHKWIVGEEIESESPESNSKNPESDLPSPPGPSIPKSTVVRARSSKATTSPTATKSTAKQTKTISRTVSIIEPNANQIITEIVSEYKNEDLTSKIVPAAQKGPLELPKRDPFKNLWKKVLVREAAKRIAQIEGNDFSWRLKLKKLVLPRVPKNILLAEQLNMVKVEN